MSSVVGEFKRRRGKAHCSRRRGDAAISSELLRTRCNPPQSSSSKVEEVGVVESLKLPKPVPPLRIARNSHNFTMQVFWDSDVGKWIEAASTALGHRRDPDIEAKIDAIVDDLARAQSPDGYLNCWYNEREPENRWTNLRDCHELYNAGHLLEGAVAYFRATGKRRLIDVMERYLDHSQQPLGPDRARSAAIPGIFQAALVYNQLHETGTALEWLSKALAAGYSKSVVSKTPNFDNLHDNPRYQALMQ